MGLISNRIEKHEIKPGDHVYTYRAVFSYSHHGAHSLFPHYSLLLLLLLFFLPAPSNAEYQIPTYHK